MEYTIIDAIFDDQERNDSKKSEDFRGHLKEKYDEAFNQLLDIRRQNMILSGIVNRKDYNKALINAEPDKLKKALYTYWRMPIAFMFTPFYANMEQILARDVYQLCMDKSCLAEVKPGELEHMTVRVVSCVRSGDSYSVNIEDPYRNTMASSRVDMTDMVGWLAYVTFTVTDKGAIEIVDAEKTDIKYKFGYEAIAPDLSDIKRHVDTHIGFSVMPMCDSCTFARLVWNALLIADDKYKRKSFSMNQEYAAALVQAVNIYVEVLQNEIHNGGTYQSAFPDEKMPPYTEIRVFEKLSDETNSLLHGLHYDTERKTFYVTREFRSPDAEPNFKYTIPLRVSLSEAQKPFYR